MKIALSLEVENMHSKFISGSGVHDFHWIFNSFLTYYDFGGTAHPMLAREIPSQEKGDWVVNPSGTMVTTYRLWPEAKWHDATPLIARDFAFAYQVYLDPDLPVTDRTPENLMSAVEAADDHTIVVHWREPFIRANQLGLHQLDPLPSHLLEEKYRTSKATFALGEEWTTGYVGTGPFRLEQWIPGSGLIGRANLDWVLGPPKLEAVEIRFIQDANTMLAHLLGGEIDFIASPGVRAGEAAVAREHWVSRGEGYLKTWHTRLTSMDFQYREVPNWQRGISDVRVRRALMHALDRQGLADVVNYGLSPAGHVFLLPSDPLFPEVDRVVTKYPFDPGRAEALLAEAGWRRAQRGAPLANAEGQSFDLEIMASGSQAQTAAVLDDNWKAAGISPAIFIIPAARERDRLLRSHFAGVQIRGRSIAADNFVWTSKHVPTAQVRWVGSNPGSFVDSEVERLQNLIVTSFDAEERRQASIALHKRMSELVGIGPLYYSVEVILAKNKVKGPIGNYGPQIGVTWNIFEWEVID